jgi:hypothetical protein
MITHHAETRMQQRGISQKMVELVMDFGAIEHHRGGEIYAMDSHAMNKLKRSVQCSAQTWDRVKKRYVVVASGHLVTVGHRYHHFKRNRH